MRIESLDSAPLAGVIRFQNSNSYYLESYLNENEPFPRPEAILFPLCRNDREAETAIKTAGPRKSF
jgi:hypothetical protein